MYKALSLCALKSVCLVFISGSFKIPAFLDAPFKSNEKCPVVIFSHGLGAFRYKQSVWSLLQYLLIISWRFCSLISCVNGLIDSSWCFLGLCIQLYVQNWPLRALLWHLWSTGTYFFIKYTYCWYVFMVRMFRIYFINFRHVSGV